MPDNQIPYDPYCPRLSPDDRLCPKYDAFGLWIDPVAEREELKSQVVDDFPEEHIM